MNIDFVIDFITKNGFPVFLVICLVYIIYYVWKFVKDEIKPGLILILDLLNKTNSNMGNACNNAERLKQKITIIVTMKKDQ